MPLVLALLQLGLLAVLLAFVFARLRPAAPAQPEAQPDPRLDRLLPLEANVSALDGALRAGVSDLRREAGADALAAREAAERHAGALRLELQGNVAALTESLHAVLNRAQDSHAQEAAALRREVLSSVSLLGETLKSELLSFRGDNAEAAGKLHAGVEARHEAIEHRLRRSAEDARAQHDQAREALHLRLRELAEANTTHGDRLRATVGDSLAKLNEDNAKKLEEMRATVDEKLHATLHTRLTESFGQVTDQLNKVHSGLGEMSKLSAGVDDLSRIFTNVKSRGGFAEVQLGLLLEQMLAPSQFVRNAKVKPGSGEMVEFAVRFPGHAGQTLLPIDAKFPREAWERLEAAYAGTDPAVLAQAGRAFEAAIRTEGRRICEKYIHPPATTPHAIMFLPTEGLYAEVARRDALQAEIQSQCHVTIAGPSTLAAILTSFQMGFHMLALQEKGDEVWKVLESAKTQFGKFEGLMDKVEGDVLKVQKTLGEVGVRTRAITRTLRDVSVAEEPVLTTGEGGLRLVADGEAAG